MLRVVITCHVGSTEIAYVTSDKDAEECTNQYAKHGGITASAESTIVTYCTRICVENSSHLDFVTDTIVRIHIHTYMQEMA